MKNCRLIWIVAGMAMWLPIISGCKSTRTVTTNHHTHGNTTIYPPRRVDYDEMKREVGQIYIADDLIAALITEAACWIGTPYLYAGHTSAGTDCSGLIMEVFDKALGTKLPRNSNQQKEYCNEVEREMILPGDLLFFATGNDTTRVSHVGLYIGENKMIHASSSRGVIVSNLAERYYNTRYHSAGRVGSVSEIYAARHPVGQAPAILPSISDTIDVHRVEIRPIEIDDIITEKIDSIFYNLME